MRVAIIGPVYPYRAGIAYCTQRTAEELARSFDVSAHSFRRQFPKMFYPGGEDVDPTLKPQTLPGAQFELDVVNPFTWISEGMRLRREKPDVVIFVWWIWVWALPYLTMLLLISRSRVVLQCHNISDKEPRAWKRWLTNRMLRRADLLITHSQSETDEARRRLGPDAPIETLFLPVHELGGEIPTRAEARLKLGLSGNVALFFGHVRPFKGLDIALRAWSLLESEVTLFVAGEVWWNAEGEYRALARELRIDERVRFDFRFIPDDEVASCFAAADVVVTPYRSEAQSGVAMTAFHFGRPVIATAVGGVPEIIDEGGNGLLVPPEDPQALAAAIDQFFTNPDRRSMENAASASAAKYSWERYGSAVGGLVGALRAES